MSMPAPPALPAVASDAIAEVVCGSPRRVQVLAAFRAAVYLAHEEGVVALVATDGVRHPNALVDTQPVAAAPFAGIRTHQQGWMGDARLVLPRRQLRVTRWFDPVPRLGPVAPEPLAVALDRARAHVTATTVPLTPDLADPVQALTGALGRGEPTMPIARDLLGRGPGLTPSGDDVLAGMLAAATVLAGALPAGAVPAELVVRVRRLGREVAAEARDATTAVSAALLHHAARGAVAAPAGAVLQALAGRGRLVAALDHLLAVGSTSGRDLAVGLLAGTELVLHAVAPAPATDRRT